ncbi:MAG: hypothetical protein QNJ64_17490 [Crocosphaera sp.]|nr:hypothetical protein [Crocosphaera sp.]
MSKQYALGFVSRSKLSKEMRSPIWYEHLTSESLNNPLIKEYIFEENFGSHTFQTAADDCLIELGCKVVDRLTLLSLSDIVVSLKPTDEWQYMRPGSTLIGWFNHLAFVPKNSTDINFLDLEDIKIVVEGKPQKLLYRNASVAGECGVVQSLERLKECDPFSPAIKQGKLAVVLGYGNVGMGATMELLRQGIEKIIVFSQRPYSEIKDKLEGVEYRQMQYTPTNTYEIALDNLKLPLIDSILPQADIIVNATIPSHSQPKWTFIPEDKFNQLKLNMIFIDPVHKSGHGANFTHVTELSNPLKLIKKSNHSIWYNGCNAMPNSRPAYASYIISKALLNHLDSIIELLEEEKCLT